MIVGQVEERLVFKDLRTTNPLLRTWSCWSLSTTILVPVGEPFGGGVKGIYHESCLRLLGLVVERSVELTFTFISEPILSEPFSCQPHYSISAGTKI